jgi:hypothetical protein
MGVKNSVKIAEVIVADPQFSIVYELVNNKLYCLVV